MPGRQRPCRDGVWVTLAGMVAPRALGGLARLPRPCRATGRAARVAQGRVRVAIDVALAAVLAVVVWYGVGRYLYQGAIQWDFATYYGAASAAERGQNPYDSGSVARAIGRLNTYPFVYSPVALRAFAPLAHLPRTDASRVWTVLKLGSLALLLTVWSCYFVPRGTRVWFVLLCAFGFRQAITRDLLTGNVSLLEELLLWSGFALFLRGRFWAFAALIAAASIFKLTLLWFWLLLLCPALGSEQRRVRILAASAAALAVTVGATVAVVPNQSREFARVFLQLAPAGPLFERGPNAPATSALLYDGLLMFARGAPPSRFLVFGLYGIVAAVVLAASWRALRRLAGRAMAIEHRRLWAIILLCFAYALVSPRFKDYSYILLLVPTFRVLFAHRRGDISRALLLGAMLIPPSAALTPRLNDWLVVFWGYYSLLVAGAAWWLALRSTTRAA
jgi:hypothetical protein